MFSTTTRIATLAILGLGYLAQPARAQTWKAAQPLDKAYNYSPQKQVAVNAAGQMYVSGGFSKTLQLGTTQLTSAGQWASYLAKHKADGSLDWATRLESPSVVDVTAIRVGSNGQVYVVGFYFDKLVLDEKTTLLAGSGTNGFVACYSEAGTLLWAQPTISSAGASITDVMLDEKGHLFTAGVFTVGTTIGLGQTSPVTATDAQHPGGVWLARLDAGTGAPQQVNLLMHSTTPQSASYYHPILAQGPAGDVFVTTAFDNSWQVGTNVFESLGRTDIAVLRLTEAGTARWAHRLGHAAMERPLKTVADAQGHLYLVGYYSLSTGTFDSFDLPNKGNEDGMLLRLSPEGKTEWAAALSSSASDLWSDLYLTPGGHPVVVGTQGSALQLGATNLPSQGKSDILVAGYKASGELLWTQQAGGADEDFGTAIAPLPNGEAVVFGSYSKNAQFGSHSLTADGLTTFLARLTPSALANRNMQAAQALQPYPNPAHTLVSLPRELAGRSMQVLDVLGRTVRTAAVSNAAQLSVQGLAPGLYTLKGTDAQKHSYIGRVQVQ